MKTIITFFSLLAITSFFYCSKVEDKSLDQSTSPLIGFNMDSFVVERWQRDRDVFLSRTKELGARVIFQSANEDSDLQIKQLEYLSSQNPDALVIVPNDLEKIHDIMNAISQKGIPIISYDRLVPNAHQDLYICFDNVNTGKLMAESAVRGIGRGSIVIINGSKADNNSYQFNKGFHQVLDPLIEIDRINIVAEKWLDSWSSEEAEKEMRILITKGIRPLAVIAANDQIAEAVIKVLVEYRLIDQVKVVGQDAELSACQRIVSGLQYSTIYKPIEQMSAIAAEMAYKLAKKEPIITNSTQMSRLGLVPTQSLKTELVNSRNIMSVVISRGFHSYDDVYRNIPEKLRPLRP